MKTLLWASLALMCLTAEPARADCIEPVMLSAIPDGASASRAEMLVAQRAIKSYENAVGEYLSCLQRAGDVSPKGNMARDKLQKLVDRFNQELTAFKAKSGS